MVGGFQKVKSETRREERRQISIWTDVLGGKTGALGTEQVLIPQPQQVCVSVHGYLCVCVCVSCKVSGMTTLLQRL